MKNKIIKKLKYYKDILNKNNMKKVFKTICQDGIKTALKKIKNYNNKKLAIFNLNIQHSIGNKFTKHAEYFDIIENYRLKSNNKLAIVFTTPCLSYGGGEWFLLSLAKAIHILDQEKKFHIYVLVPEFIGECNPKIHGEYNFLTVISCRDFIPKDNLQLSYNFLRMFISLIKPVILHNVNSALTWQLMSSEPDFIKKYVRRNYASIFCPQYDRFGNLEGFAKEFLQEGIKTLDLLISDNTNFKIFAKDNFAIGKNDLEKIVAVYAPNKFGMSDTVRMAQQKNLTFIQTNTNNIKLVSIGRLDEQKNIGLLFDIANLYPELQIYIYGTKLVDDIGIPKDIPINIYFKGVELDITKIMLENDYTAMVMTSKYEGIPTILIICGYLNIPIIAPDVGGISNLLNSRTGYLLASNPTPQDYRKAIEQIVGNPRERLSKINAMRNLIEIRHSYETLCNSLKQLKYLPGDSPSASTLPIVSVIIPCYNQYQFLVSCLESVYRAYNGPLDIIVIDDFSSDNKKKHYQRLINNIFSDVRFINNDKNYVVSASRNTGIDHAIGEYIQFLDCDDILLPNKISIQVCELTGSWTQVIISDYLLSDNDMSSLKYESSIRQFNLSLENFLLFWERGFCIPLHTGLFSSSIKNIKWDSSLTAKEDWLFWISLIENGYELRYVDFIGVIYRMNSDRVTNSKFIMSGKAWVNAAYDVLNRIKLEDVELKAKFLQGVATHYMNYYIPNSISEMRKLASNKMHDDIGLVINQDKNDISEYKLKIDEFAAQFKLSELRADITIIVPVYNHFDYLWQCIKSAINQSVAVEQVILVNDNSSDNRVIDLLLFIEKNFNNLVKVINFTKNIGISQSQNYAIKEAKSKYIAFLDCDDYLEANAIETVNEILTQDMVDYVFTDNYHICSGSKILSQYGGYKNIRYSSDAGICIDLLDGMVANHFKVIKKESMLTCGLFDESISGVQDWDMALKFCVNNFMFKYIPKPVYNHRIHESSVTNSMRTMQFKLMNIVRRKYLKLSYKHVIDDRNENMGYIKARCELSKIKELLNKGKAIVFVIDDTTTLDDYWFVNEFNAYFNKIFLSDATKYAFICGYLWDPKIVVIKSPLDICYA